MKKEYVVIEFNSLDDFLKQMETENISAPSSDTNLTSNKTEKKIFETNPNIEKNKNNEINKYNNNKNNIDNYNTDYQNTELNDESRLVNFPDNTEKEELEERNKEKIMLEELSKIIQQESSSLLNTLPLSSRNKSLNDKISCYRKSVMNSANFIEKNKKEEFLAEASPEIINPFGRNWLEMEKEIKANSAFRNFETYEVKNFIAKANDDLRQELMTMQLIKRFDDIFKASEIPLKLKPYEILITSPTSGLIEFIPNTISIDALKKKIAPISSLNVFFRQFFVINFEEAQKNFAESLAAYCIVQYVLSIRDRFVFIYFFLSIYLLHFG